MSSQGGLFDLPPEPHPVQRGARTVDLRHIDPVYGIATINVCTTCGYECDNEHAAALHEARGVAQVNR